MRGQRMVTRLLAVALLLSLSIGLPLARTTARAQDDKLKIVFSVPGLNFPFFVHMMKIAHDKADELGVDLIEQDGKNDSATQSAGIESAIAQGVDGIVISPLDVEALAPAIQAATDAGIPVVTVDRNVTGAKTLAHVGADNVRGGEKQGEFLLTLLPNGGKVIELEGQTGASPAIDRDKGFKQAVQGHPEIEIVFDQTAAFARDQALTVTEQALQAHPDVSAIVAANDDMAFGAAEAADGAGIDVPIIGFDALPESLQAIQDGTLKATIEQWPGKQTSGAMQILFDYIKDDKEPAQHDNFIEPTLITIDNLGEAERAEEAGITPSATPEATPVS
jgi:ABC-type sugar transport system substrate-binding protein